MVRVPILLLIDRLWLLPSGPVLPACLQQAGSQGESRCGGIHKFKCGEPRRDKWVCGRRAGSALATARLKTDLRNFL
jgi:hypothetical protein